MHILITVNAAWNVLNFRRPIVAAMIADGHRVTVLAPRDDSVAAMAGGTKCHTSWDMASWIYARSIVLMHS